MIRVCNKFIAMDSMIFNINIFLRYRLMKFERWCNLSHLTSISPHTKAIMPRHFKRTVNGQIIGKISIQAHIC